MRDVTRLSAAACPDNEYGTAIACTDFVVYLKDTVLTYIREKRCEKNARGRFLLSVIPRNPADVPDQFRETGHQSMNFDFPEDGETPNGGCFFQVKIPDYPIDALEIGQWVKGPDGGGLWGRRVEDIERLRFLSCDSAEYGTPVGCADFGVYLKGVELTYEKEPCAPQDTRGRFLLNAFPTNPADLPENRRELGTRQPKLRLRQPKRRRGEMRNDNPTAELSDRLHPNGAVDGRRLPVGAQNPRCAPP